MTDLQALLDATPDGETCVIPSANFYISGSDFSAGSRLIVKGHS